MSKLEVREQVIQHGIYLLSQYKKQQGNEVVEGTRRKWEQTSPSDHYHIGKSSRNPVDITVWLGSNLEDRAMKVSVLLLQYPFVDYL